LYGKNTFVLERVERDLPCPAGPGCQASHTNDEYVYFPGCWICQGKGTRTKVTEVGIGHLMSNVAIAFALDRAFTEGHSAGLGDAS
jgi:hypothetical protein